MKLFPIIMKEDTIYREIKTIYTGDVFKVKKRIVGGLGVVYIAERERDHLLYALKTFKEEYHPDWYKKFLITKKFEWESHVWIILGKHRNIVQAHWFDYNQDYRPFLIMEYIEGADYGNTLWHWLYVKNKNKLPEFSAVLQICIQILTALIYAKKLFHQELKKPFIHRDLKPQNILLTQTEQVKVTDFGLVKAFGLLREDAGTPLYMPPEQKDRAEVEEKTDIFALGKILFQLLTKEIPSHVIPITNRDLPAQINEVIARCVAPLPEDRFSFVALRCLLQQFFFQKNGFFVPVSDKPEPFLAEDWHNRGSGFNQLRLYKKALFNYSKAIEAEPGDARFFLNRGNVYFRTDKIPAALRDFERALSIDGKMIEIYISKGSALAKYGKPEEALSCFESARRLDPDDARIHWGKGLVYAKLERFYEAITELNTALKLNPNLAEAHLSLGNIYFLQKKYNRAEKHFEKAIKINTFYKQAYLNLAQAYQINNRFEKLADLKHKIEFLSGDFLTAGGNA